MVPIEGLAPISSRRSVNRTLVNCDPASEWVTSPTSRRLPLERLAIMTRSAGCLPELAGAVDLAVHHPQHHQYLHHRCVAHRPGRRLPLAAFGGVVRARRHLQGLADGLDSELVTVAVDVVDDQRCGRSSSAAKKADADLRIEFAR